MEGKTGFLTRRTPRHTLPFCSYTLTVPWAKLKALILRKKGLVGQPESLGDHLRNRRLVLSLKQRDAAHRLGVMREVYDLWERNERATVVSVWPSVIAFLGYYPGNVLGPD